MCVSVCVRVVRVCVCEGGEGALTLGVLQRLFFLGGFRDDLDPLGEESSSVASIAKEYLHTQTGYQQCSVCEGCGGVRV